MVVLRKERSGPICGASPPSQTVVKRVVLRSSMSSSNTRSAAPMPKELRTAGSLP